MDRSILGWMDIHYTRMIKWTERRMIGWTDRRMIGWTDRRMIGLIYISSNFFSSKEHFYVFGCKKNGEKLSKLCM